MRSMGSRPFPFHYAQSPFIDYDFGRSQKMDPLKPEKNYGARLLGWLATPFFGRKSQPAAYVQFPTSERTQPHPYLAHCACVGKHKNRVVIVDHGSHTKPRFWTWLLSFPLIGGLDWRFGGGFPIYPQKPGVHISKPMRNHLRVA